MSEITRLLVELNRSPGHPGLYSEISSSLERHERQRLLELYYHPYRDAVIRQIEQLLAGHERVCHVSLHSFTPELNGKVRNADIGLLYDPKRPREKTFCLNWQGNINRREEGWTVRRNYPYRGTMDGFVTLLRRRFPADRYLGFELEVNQRWPLQGGGTWRTLQALLRDTLRQTLGCSSVPDFDQSKESPAC
jgi:predicted N-formylglutamate amidohydrolase